MVRLENSTPGLCRVLCGLPVCIYAGGGRMGLRLEREVDALVQTGPGKGAVEKMSLKIWKKKKKICVSQFVSLRVSRF